MKAFDVVGFGALNVDKLFKVNKIVGADEEGFITSCEEACGGSAANTIVGLARLGCSVGFVGKVADDREGRMLLDDFRNEGVDTGGIICTGEGRSGIGMGFIDRKGDRALYIDPGVNDTISLSQIDWKYASQSKFLHMTSFVGEESFQAQKELVARLPENVRVSLDPGELYARKGWDGLEPLLKRTYVVMPNSAELELLTGIKDYKKGAEFLLNKGISVVAAKLGSGGCYVADANENNLIEPFKVKAVDTTGAGDAFCAGFLFGLISKRSLYDCGRIGNFVASRCIMKMGARAGLPRLTELEASELV